MVEVKIIYGHLKPDLKEFSGVTESKVYFPDVAEAVDFAESFLENALPVRTTERDWDSRENKFYEFETVSTYKVEIGIDCSKIKPLISWTKMKAAINKHGNKTACTITDFSGTEIGTIEAETLTTEDDVEDI